ncbi:uncharacterized protein MONBRDRAFT_8188 [Monosiga brevicollis MX1]|uniref:Endonuclease/exonuclease/phosphatase domain-containing protein n=1 Tax=Monosiga brevicollis TaxID=81824 RepID=A9UZB2_MONBE|nr:uncharacterized protein MONBRDRAFT_8188 [Monosiga brevicollis MX1]EDQ89337.1 predicted protein [Monosiga brevicollis MX1]|eukprot:XP_001745913.1 hypothetical protein [Monosiga brevicollis MX1]
MRVSPLRLGALALSLGVLALLYATRCPPLLEATPTPVRPRAVAEEAGDALITYYDRKQHAAMLEMHRLNDFRKDVGQALRREAHQSELRRALCRYCLPADLTVATYNLFGLRLAWETRWTGICKILGNVQADVLALQEVMKHEPTSTQAHLLAQELGYEYVYYARAHEADPKEGGEEGLAIVSRFPAAVVQTVPLTPMPGSVDANARVFLHARFDTIPALAGESLHVLANHWTYDATAQCHAARELLAYLDALPAADHVVLLGDLNIYVNSEWPLDWLTNRVPAPLREHTVNRCAEAMRQYQAGQSDSARRPAFRDVWHTSFAWDPGWTFTNFHYTNRTNLYERATRPDRILLRSEALVERDVYLFGDALDGLVQPHLYASDHRGVATTFAVRPGGAKEWPTGWARLHYPALFDGDGSARAPALRVRFTGKLVRSAEEKPPAHLPLKEGVVMETPMPGHSVTLMLQRPARVSRVTLRFGGCASPHAEPGLVGTIPEKYAVLEALYYESARMDSPSWSPLAGVVVGSTGTWQWSQPLDRVLLHSESSWRSVLDLEPSHHFPLHAVRLRFTAAVDHPVLVCHLGVEI